MDSTEKVLRFFYVQSVDSTETIKIERRHDTWGNSFDDNS